MIYDLVVGQFITMTLSTFFIFAAIIILVIDIHTSKLLIPQL